jgi:hypothetical protein
MTLVISKGITLAKGFTWNETVWNPSMISTALWLDAADSSTITESGSAVSEWRDKSGNLRNATQGTAANRPQYSAALLNNKNVVTFSGTGTNDDFLDLAVSARFSNHRTLAIVYSDTATTAFTTPIGTIYSSSAGSYHGADSNALQNLFGLAAGQADSQTTSGSNFRNGTSIGNGAGVGRPSTAAVHVFISAGAFPSGQLVFRMGADGSLPGGRSINGSIAEIIMLTTAASTDTRQRLEGYLSHKWGLTANLPNDHPYKTVGPTP